MADRSPPLHAPSHHHHHPPRPPRSAANEAEARRIDVQRQLMADSARLAALVARCRRAKEAVEAGLSAKLGRRINIMGEVNNLI